MVEASLDSLLSWSCKRVRRMRTGAVTKTYKVAAAGGGLPRRNKWRGHGEGRVSTESDMEDVLVSWRLFGRCALVGCSVGDMCGLWWLVLAGIWPVAVVMETYEVGLWRSRLAVIGCGVWGK